MISIAIKLFNVPRSQRSRLLKLERYFSTTKISSSVSPYYILGVDQSATLDEIKKQYYKLASEYHPDKNSSPEASKRFVVIKEAYETIIKWQGKDVKMDLERSHNRAQDFQSVRPNASQYRDDFEEEKMRDSAEYKEFAYKAGIDPETQKFKDSFEAIYEIKDIKFRADDVELPDPSKRFNLDDRVKIKAFSDSSIGVIAIVTLFFGVAFFAINRNESKVLDEMGKNMLEMLRSQETAEVEVIKDRNQNIKQIAATLEKDRNYQTFQKKLQKEMENGSSLNKKLVPSFQPVYRVNNYQSDEDDTG